MKEAEELRLQQLMLAMRKE